MLVSAPSFARAYVGEGRSGGSRPQLFTLDSDELALVKFRDCPQGPRVVVNEVLGYGLADLIGIDCPPGGVVEISEGLLPHGGVLELPETKDFDAITLHPGPQFYSTYLENEAQSVSPMDFGGTYLQNLNSLVGAVVLDLLLNNWDRRPANVNMLKHRQGQVWHVKVFDFGHSIGGGVWERGNLHDVELPPQYARLPYAGDVGLFLERILNPASDFAFYLERLALIDESSVTAILDIIPNSWLPSSAEREGLLEYLIKRARAIPDYVRSRLKSGREWWL